MHQANPLPPEPAQRKINAPLFFLVLLLPTLLTLLSAAAGKADANTTGYFAIYGSGVAGLCCGAILARRMSGAAVEWVALAIVFGVALGFVSFILSFVGCALGAGLAHH